MGIDTLATMEQLDLLLNNEIYESITILLYKRCSAYFLVIHPSSTAYYGMALQSTEAMLKDVLVPCTPGS